MLYLFWVNKKGLRHKTVQQSDEKEDCAGVLIILNIRLDFVERNEMGNLIFYRRISFGGALLIFARRSCVL